MDSKSNVSENIYASFEATDYSFWMMNYKEIYSNICRVLPKRNTPFENMSLEETIGCEVICAAICHQIKTMCSIIYLILLSAVLLILCAGLVLLINVLIAKVDNSEVSNNSPIFFSGINSYKDIKEYSENIYKMSKDDILNELISEIYINADIATKKYKKYNIGLKLTISGFIVFIILILIGLYNF